MKSKIIILALVVILIGLFSMFNITNSYPFKENVLYNQDDISGYNETQTESSNLVNRNEAIKIAKYYIGNILGNDLSEEENSRWKQLDDEILDHELRELMIGEKDRPVKSLASVTDMTERNWKDVAEEFIILAEALIKEK